MSLPAAGYSRAEGVVDCDIRGQMCPSTLLAALREVNERRRELRSGALTLCFHTDNREATSTIPDALQNMGYAVHVTKDEGHYVITVCAAAPG